MTRYLAVPVVLVMLFAGQSQAQTRLRDLADARQIYIGAAVRYWPMVKNATYSSTLSQQYNIVTPENAMKWASIHPQQTQYDFSQADAIVSFAQQNGMAVHGHNLAWGVGNPNWLTQGNFNHDQLVGILNDHINTVVGHYQGNVVAWDVVNEAVNTNGTLRSNIWLDGIGPEYIDMAFQAARAADPNAVLIYNDYDAEELNPKSDAIYALVSDMLNRGIPIDGIGFEMHLTSAGRNLDSFAQNMQRFADLGLQIYVSEMDVRLALPASADDLANQAQIYGGVLNACLQQSACRSFQSWGFTDAYSWIPGYFPGYGAALVFDQNYNPKPAYDALVQVLQ